ncbi:unnamed protein product [Cylindrotheca closterium]|uniref:Uncharacterized protein n=1 Tax=Cylindrotheca closterium TaxID=2856 RepID=A0AAD2G5B7_9STRA|nr:unnamed protein product [Cylindrotheca closterium]
MSEEGEKKAASQEAGDANREERKSRSNKHRPSSRDLVDDILVASERKSSQAKPVRRRSKDDDDDDDGLGDPGKRPSKPPSRRKSRDSHDSDELGGSSSRGKRERKKSKDSMDGIAVGVSDRRSIKSPSRRKSRDSNDGAIDTSKRSTGHHRSRSRDSNDSLANDQEAKIRVRRKTSGLAMPGAFVETKGVNRGVRRKGDGSKSPLPISLWTQLCLNLTSSRHRGAPCRSCAANKKSSMISSRHHNSPARNSDTNENEVILSPIDQPGSSVPQRTGNVEALEATTIDEMKTAHRGEKRDNLVFVAAPATSDDDKSKKYEYIFAAFVIFAIAVGVIKWLLVAGRPQEVNIFVTYDHPASEDCRAMSQGNETKDQIGTTVKYFGAGMEFGVAPSIDLDFLETELQLRLQRDALPEIAGCDRRSSPIIENNIFVVENAVLRSIALEDYAICSSNSTRMCSPVCLEHDIYSKE